VRLENEPRLPSWFVFDNPSFHSIPLTTLALNASISNNDVPRDHHNNDDTNPKKGLGAVRRGEPSYRMATVSEDKGSNDDSDSNDSNDDSGSNDTTIAAPTTRR
jgi:hypothetical protein